MGEHKRPRGIISLENGKKPGDLVTPDKSLLPTPQPMSIEEALQADIEELRQYLETMRDAIRIHHETLNALVPLVHDFERQTLVGRIRSARTWCAVQYERLRLLGMELGVISPIAPPPQDPPTPTQE